MRNLSVVYANESVCEQCCILTLGYGCCCYCCCCDEDTIVEQRDAEGLYFFTGFYRLTPALDDARTSYRHFFGIVDGRELIVQTGYYAGCTARISVDHSSRRCLKVAFLLPAPAAAAH
jgi:hypothetical protein